MGIISSLRKIFSSLFNKKDSATISVEKVQEQNVVKGSLENNDIKLQDNCYDESSIVIKNTMDTEEITEVREVEEYKENTTSNVDTCDVVSIESSNVNEEVKQAVVIEDVINNKIVHNGLEVSSENAEIVSDQNNIVVEEENETRLLDSERVIEDRVDEEIEDDEITIKVSESFIENKYNMFRSLCESKDIISINGIHDDIMVEFCKLPGAGVKKVSDTKEKLIELWENNRAYMKFTYNVLSISFIFCEVDFENFRDFCNEKGILNIKHITEENIETFKENGVYTKKTLERILDRINLYNEIDYPEIEIQERPIEEIELIVSSYWFDRLKNNKISDIASCLNIEVIESDNLLSDIQGKISSEFNKEYAKYLIKFIGSINSIKTPSEIIEGIEGALKNERLKTILHDRYTVNSTLEEVGQKEGITRERVRQLQKKAETSVIGYLSSSNFSMSIQLEFIGKDMCGIEEFNKLFKDEGRYFAPVILSQQGLGLTVIETLDAIMFKETSNLDMILSNIVNRLPNLFKMSNYIREMKIALKGVGLENPSLRVIDNILVQNGYKKYGKYYSRDKITIITACEIIFRDYIDKPLRLDDEGATYIRELALNHLEVELGDTTRSIEARVRDSQEIILVDRLTFFHLDNINLENKTIEYIGEYLKQEFENREVVNATYLFENNEEYWVNNNITSKYMLYSLIGYYYGEKYKIGVGNSLDIYVDKDAVIYTREERLIEIVKQYNGRIEKEVAIDVSGWSTIKIDDTISKSEKLIREGREIVLVD